jgi:YcxB-like protein
MESLVFEFQPIAAETVRASRLLRRRARFGWMHWLTWPLILGLALMYKATGVAWSQMGFLWFAVLLLAAVSLGGPVIQRWQLQRAYADSPILRERQQYEFSSDGLTIRGGPAASRFGWDAFREAVETDEFIVLFVARQTAYYLPKHALHGPDVANALRTLLHSALGDRARNVRPVPFAAPPI